MLRYLNGSQDPNYFSDQDLEKIEYLYTMTVKKEKVFSSKEGQ